LLVLGGCATDWSHRNVVLETSYQVINAMDAYSSTGIHRRDDLIESGFPTVYLLGRNPAPAHLVMLHVLYGVAHIVIADRLSEPWRTSFQFATLAVSAAAVANNCENGLC
jgi:hypothetical protein